MTFLESLARVRLNLTRPRRLLTPYIVLKGRINSNMSRQVGQLLQQIPKRTKMLGVVISSAGGPMSQAVIISEILKRKAKECDFELVTFAEQFALNSAYYLLTQGNRVYADRTTMVGGLQIGQSKMNLGLLSQYIDRIVYAQDSSFVAQSRKSQPYSQPKATQLKQLYSQFSEDMKKRILSARNSKIQQSVDLTKYYTGEQAQKLGLIDGIGRVHQTIPKLVENPYIQLVRKGRIDRLISDMKKIQIRG